MDFVNESGVEAGWTMGFERSGRELLVVTAKATFVIPHEPGPAPLATEQAKLTEADTFTDAPGPDEVVIAVAVATRGRLHARLGGPRTADIIGQDGLR